MCNHVCSSGSKDYVVEVGDSAVGPWTKIAEGQMEASKPFPRIEITLGHPHSGRFVQYRCVTWWSNYCGLQFIRVYKMGGKYFLSKLGSLVQDSNLILRSLYERCCIDSDWVPDVQYYRRS